MKIKSFISVLWERLQRRWLFLILFVSLHLLSIYFINFDIQTNLERGKYLFILFSAVGHLFGVLSWAFFLQVIVLLFKDKLAKIVSCFFLGLSFTVALSELFVIFKYRSPITDSIVASILGTNDDEVLEFFSNFENILYIGLASLLLLIVLFLVWGIMKLTCKYFPILKILLPIAISASSAFATGWYFYKYIPYQRGHKETGSAFYWGMSGIDRLHCAIQIYQRDTENLKKNIDLMKYIELENLSVNREFEKLNLIVIMGESLRRNSMHLYGSDIPNTPFLDSLLQSQNLIVFSDVACSGTNTSLAVPYSLTFYRVSEHTDKNWTDFPTLIKAIKQSGFATYWLSNQENRGAFANPISSIAHTADSVVYTKDRSSLDYYDESFNGDELVLPLLRKAEDKNLFSLIHLMGSHEKYNRRYPKKFDIFKPLDDREESKIIADYNNSILYNDYVIGRIVTHYEKDNAIIVYLSDHGIELYDNPENQGHQGHASSPYIASVPFMVYMSDKAKSLYPDIYKCLLGAIKHPFSTDALSVSLVDLLGITTDYSSDNSCAFRKTYAIPDKRLLKSFERVIELDSLVITPDRHKQYITTK